MQQRSETVAGADYDILIVGAGAVGAAFACALAGSRYRVAVIEAKLPPQTDKQTDKQTDNDGRGLALSLNSQRLLERIGVWEQLAEHSNPIREIHVSHRGRFGSVRLDAGLLNSEALGYVTPAARLGRALLDSLKAAANIDFLCPASLASLRQDSTGVSADVETAGPVRSLRSRLLIGADGSQSRVRDLCGIGVRSKDYGQTAIVCGVHSERAHTNIAWERFTDSGPCALLPLVDGSLVSVCCVASADADRWLGLADADYAALLETRFGHRLGRFRTSGPRQSYPIRLIESERQRDGRVLLLGNSVHTVHPNAAQGFNLGLHDAAALAAEMLHSNADVADAGDESLLTRYLERRRPVQKRVVRFTDTLAWLFYQPHPFVGPLLGPGRGLAMLAMDLLPGAKRAFLRRTAGLNQ